MRLLAVHADDAGIDPVVGIRLQALDTAKRIFEVWVDVRGRTAARVERIVRMRVRRRGAVLGRAVFANDSSAAVISVRRLRQQAAKICTTTAGMGMPL